MKRTQFVGEQLVDAQVARGVGAGIFLQINAIMEDRPEHAVGQAVVVFLIIDGREIDQRVRYLVHLDRLRLRGRLVVDLAAPAKPESVRDFSARP